MAQNKETRSYKFVVTEEIRAEWDNRIHPTLQDTLYDGLKAPDDDMDAELLQKCQEQKAADALKQVEAAKYRLRNAEYALEWAKDRGFETEFNNTRLQADVTFAVEKVAKTIDTHRFHTNAAHAYWYYLQ
tara:strand:+ start:454 stop:843 length:390 start_codon:yes stop_codon:yes gene_type:complete